MSGNRKRVPVGRLDPTKLEQPPASLCVVARIIAELDDDDMRLLEGAVIEQVTFERLAKWLTGAGLKVSGSAMRNHLRGICGCPDDIRLKGVR